MNNMLQKGYGRPILCPNRLKKTMIKTSFDSHPYPAGTNRLNAQVGFLTHPVCRAFPAFASGKECNKPKLPKQESGYTATGIVPDSHRIPFSLFSQQTWHLSSMCIANVCDIFGFAKQFCESFFFLPGLYLRYKILMSFSNRIIFSSLKSVDRKKRIESLAKSP